MTEPQPKPPMPPQHEPEMAPASAEVTNIADKGAANLATVEAMQLEINGLKDQLLRALAEGENARRRAQKEREDTSKYAVTNFAKEMLAVADNFRRALDATPKDNSDPALKNLVTGIEATERQLQAALERNGIKKLEPLGQAFDPHFHQVMMEVDDPNSPAGSVVQVLQAGYTIHDRLLREALVGVAKGGPSAAKVDRSA